MRDDMETMKIEQIDVIAEILGQRKNASYCTMSNFGTDLLKNLEWDQWKVEVTL